MAPAAPRPWARAGAMLLCASSTHPGCGFNLGLVHSPSSSAHSWSVPPTLPYFGVKHNPGVGSARVQIHWEAERVHMRSLGRCWAHCKLCVTAHQTLMAPL